MARNYVPGHRFATEFLAAFGLTDLSATNVTLSIPAKGAVIVTVEFLAERDRVDALVEKVTQKRYALVELKPDQEIDMRKPVEAAPDGSNPCVTSKAEAIRLLDGQGEHVLVPVEGPHGTEYRSQD